MQSKQILFSCLVRAQTSTTHLGKEIGLNPERTDIQQKMHGWAVGDFVQTISVPVAPGQTMSQILQLIQSIECGSGYLVQGIIPSLPPGKFLPLSTRNKITAGQAPEGAVARSNDNFELPIGPGILVGDVDRQMSQHSIYEAYKQVIPELDRFPFMIRASSSAGLVRNGQYIKAADHANHFYLPTDNASLNARVLEIMHIRAWAHGHGWAFVTKAGAILERSIVDLALKTPSQPVYVAYCAPYPNGAGALNMLFSSTPTTHQPDDLWQNTKQVTLYEGDGSGQLFDPQAYIEAYERDKEATDKRYRERREVAFREVESLARETRKAHLLDIEKSITEAKLGQTSDPLMIMAAHQNNELIGSEPLHIGRDRWIQVKDILLSPKKYDDKPLADPIEPYYNDSFTVAKIYANLDNKYAPFKINSKAHGEDQAYVLLWDRVSIEALIHDPPEGFDLGANWPKLLYHSRMGVVDESAIIRKLARALGSNSRAVLDEYRSYRERASGQGPARQEVAKVPIEQLSMSPTEYQGLPNLITSSSGDQDRVIRNQSLLKVSAFAALVRVAGKNRVVNQAYNEGLGQLEWIFNSFRDVEDLFRDKRLNAGRTYFEEWLETPIKGKQYASIAFIPVPGLYVDSHILRPDGQGGLVNPYPMPTNENCLIPPPDPNKPGVFNLYRGLALRPQPGQWKMMKFLFEEIWCDGDPDKYNFLHQLHKRWFFLPHIRQELALLVRSITEGVGKSSMDKFYSRVWGAAALLLQDQEGLKRRFNSSLANKMLILVDESVSDARDKNFRGQLKNLITSPTLNIEYKGLEIQRVRHFANFIFFSNEQHATPFGLESRRALPLKAKLPKVYPDGMTKKQFFDALHLELDNGGPAAYLHFLSELAKQGPDRLTKPSSFTDASNLVANLENETPMYRFLFWMVTRMNPSEVTMKDVPDGHPDKQPKDASAKKAWYQPRGIYVAADRLEQVQGLRGLSNMFVDKQVYPSELWDDHAIVICRADLEQIYKDWQLRTFNRRVEDSKALVLAFKNDFKDMADVPALSDDSRLSIDTDQQRVFFIRSRKVCQEVLQSKQNEVIDFDL